MIFQNAVERFYGVVKIFFYAENLIRVEQNTHAEKLFLNSVRVEHVVRGIAFSRLIKNRLSVFCFRFVAFGNKVEFFSDLFYKRGLFAAF